MPTIPYAKNYAPWQNLEAGATPILAAKLDVFEEGITNVSYAPCVRVYHSANINLNTATDTALGFDSERFDQAGNAADTMHDTVTNNGRLTCRYAGVYQITGSVMFQAHATGFRLLRIRHQGTTFISHGMIPVNSGSLETAIVTSALYALAVNEYVELVAQQTSGAGLNVLAVAASSPEFMMVRVG